MISVVIPTVDPGPRFALALAALGPGAAAGLVGEIVVADGGSDPAALAPARAAGARIVEATGGRGGQLRAGCAAATGDWLLVLHADTVLSLAWVEAARRHMAARPDAAGWFDLSFDQGGWKARLWARGVAARCALLGLPYGDQGLLIPRALYEAVGGYPDQPLLEDVELARRLGRRRLARAGAVAVTSAERYRRDGWLRRTARNAAILLRWRLGADPAELARRYG